MTHHRNKTIRSQKTVWRESSSQAFPITHSFVCCIMHMCHILVVRLSFDTLAQPQKLNGWVKNGHIHYYYITTAVCIYKFIRQPTYSKIQKTFDFERISMLLQFVIYFLFFVVIFFVYTYMIHVVPLYVVFIILRETFLISLNMKNLKRKRAEDDLKQKLTVAVMLCVIWII